MKTALSRYLLRVYDCSFANVRSKVVFASTLPKSISDYVGIPPDIFAATGAFDAILDVDSLLFIDPHLLSSSSAPEIAASYDTVRDRFRKILKVLTFCKKEGDAFWATATKLFTFPELKGLCIGYSGNSTAGAGMGARLRQQILRTAKSIVDAGVLDPELFELVGVFEQNVGPDRISDMVGRIIVEHLLTYSQRILKELDVKGTTVLHKGNAYQLVRNPYNGSPVILIPRDVLRDLPTADDWSEIDVICAHNDQVRQRINTLIGNTWKQATSEKKETLRAVLISEPEVMADMLRLYKSKPSERYDFENDPSGEVAWYRAAQVYTRHSPLHVELSSPPTAVEVVRVVTAICEKFKDLVENNGLSALLYDGDGKPKHESAAQKLFYGIADAYCHANSLDLSREANAGRGPVDFKVSGGYSSRVVVEAKLTTNPQLVHGFTVQVEEYQKAEKTAESIYLVPDVGGLPKRKKDLLDLISIRKLKGERVPVIIFVDARPKASASTFQPPKPI